MSQVNVFTIHSSIINNIDELIEKEIDDIDVENFRRTYLKNLVPLYMKYGVAVEEMTNMEKFQEMYFKELNRCSVIQLNNKLASKYKLYKIYNTYQQESGTYQELCTCGEIMVSDHDQFLKCEKCANVKRNIINSSQIFKNDSSSTGRGGYKHNGHYMTVYKNIFCLENFTFSDEKKLDILRKSIADYSSLNNIDEKDISHIWFRHELKHLKLSRWFSHVNLLKSHLTGFKITPLTELEDMTLHTYYQIYQKIFDRIKKVGQSYLRCNYVIYKILHQTIIDSKRKSIILSHIFLPEKDTLKKLDLIYCDICKESDGILTYTPTYRVM